VYVLGYALVALYFFLQAIESLRPRKSQPQVSPVTQTGIEEFPLGIRFYEDILRRDVEDYKRAWREVHVGQLNAELAVQAHALAGINRAKYGALRRLYSGLKLMTLLAVGLVGLAALATALGTARKVTRAARRGEKILGTAERITNPGVKEPSGVTFHKPSGHLFVVGDDGGLAELDAQGKVLSTTKIESQIEDVTVHTPTGLLVLISESRSELIVYDPATHQERKRWPLDADAMVGAPITDRNQGFEGVVFRPVAGQPGGGIFYLTHQRSPAIVVALAFDPTGPVHRLGAEVVLSRWSMSYQDLTAITWSDGPRSPPRHCRREGPHPGRAGGRRRRGGGGPDPRTAAGGPDSRWRGRSLDRGRPRQVPPPPQGRAGQAPGHAAGRPPRGDLTRRRRRVRGDRGTREKGRSPHSLTPRWPAAVAPQDGC
jgi:hypothetical protein